MAQKRNCSRGFVSPAILFVAVIAAAIGCFLFLARLAGTGTEPADSNPFPIPPRALEATASSGIMLPTGTVLISPPIAAPSPTRAKKEQKGAAIGPQNALSNIQHATDSAVSQQPNIPGVQPPAGVVSPAASGDDALPEEEIINPAAIVGVLCYFNTALTNSDNGKTVPGPKEEVRGSGVIIDSGGYILTNRHVIAQPAATTTVAGANGNILPITIDYSLDHCEIGQLASGSRLPTPSEIQSINPYVQIPVLGYTAQPVFISSPVGLSDAEIDAADFAVLRVTGLTSAGPTFGVTSVPSSFPYVKLFPAGRYLAPGTPVVTYGFPGDITAGQGNSFETLTIEGSVGSVTEVDVGDRYYADTPLVIFTNMDVTHGRSGSPLFWRGYVVGLITFYIGANRTDSGSVASDAILKALRSTQYNPNYN